MTGYGFSVDFRVKDMEKHFIAYAKEEEIGSRHKSRCDPIFYSGGRGPLKVFGRISQLDVEFFNEMIRIVG